MPEKKINPIKVNKKSPIKVPFTEGSDMIGFFNTWMNSPEYKNRLQNNGYKSPSVVQNNRVSALGNIDILYDTSVPNMSNSPVTRGSKAFVNINKDEVNSLGANVDSVKAHEISHATGAKLQVNNPNVGFNKVEEELLRNSIINKGGTHVSKPDEMKADLDSNRWKMFDGGIYDIRNGQPFTQDHLNKAKERLNTDDTFKRLIDQVGDDNYIKLMNTIAQNGNENNIQMAKFGGYTQGNPGLKQTDPKFRKLWDSDPKIRAFRDSFLKEHGYDPDPYDKESSYDYINAVLSGERPEIHPEDGRYHWSSQFKADDHPNRFVRGVDTKLGNQLPVPKFPDRLTQQDATYVNPLIQEQFAFGGMMGGLGGASGMLSSLIPQQNSQGLTSVGGAAASGALQGISAGAMLGPVGMGIGALGMGTLGLIQAKKKRAEEEEVLQSQRDSSKKQQLASMNYGLSQSSNLPMASGGYVNPMSDSIGDFTSFNGGGTHEQNPNGGIPMGTNPKGQQITVEDGESQYNFKDGKYVFSNRLKII